MPRVCLGELVRAFAGDTERVMKRKLAGHFSSKWTSSRRKSLLIACLCELIPTGVRGGLHRKVSPARVQGIGFTAFAGAC